MPAIERDGYARMTEAEIRRRIAHAQDRVNRADTDVMALEDLFALQELWAALKIKGCLNDKPAGYSMRDKLDDIAGAHQWRHDGRGYSSNG